MGYLNTENATECRIPDGNFGLPLIRENIEFIKDPDSYLLKKQNTYGNIFKTHLIGKPTIVVIGKEWINYVLSNESDFFELSFPPALQKLVGNSISTQHGYLHEERRNILSKIFKYKYLKSYESRLEEITHKYVDRWLKLEEIDLYKELKKYSFDIACDFLVGESELSNCPIFQDYEVWEKGLFSIPIKLPTSNFKKACDAKQRICSYIEKLILKANASRNRNSAISIMLDHGLQPDEIQDQILSLLFAGHGTLASSMWSICHNLDNNKLFISQYRNLLNDSNNNYKLENFLNAIINESLRLSPPIPGGFRKIIKTNYFNGIIFPKGWNVVYQIRQTEIDPKRYSSPNNFNPQRFLSGSNDKLFVFGGGMRECIGKELAKKELFIFSRIFLEKINFNFVDRDQIKFSNLPVVHPTKKISVKVCRT